MQIRTLESRLMKYFLLKPAARIYLWRVGVRVQLEPTQVILVITTTQAGGLVRSAY